MGNDNGKWQLAFWIMAVIFVGWAAFLTVSISTVDKARACEDDKIKTSINSQYQEVLQRLTRIETKLEK